MSEALGLETKPQPAKMTPGTSVGPYTLLTLIATGGMGEVWAARLNGTAGFSRLVALKVIRSDLVEDPDYVAMFLDEANVASAIHHPNVCEVFELGEEAGVLYIAMEWLRGDSLAALLGATEAHSLPPAVVARIVSDACAGLHAVHEAVDDEGRALNVVHRDISPQNLLITEDGFVKVADFGIAKAAKQVHKPTATGQVKGEVAFIAPEQLEGKPYDRRCDIFSMGCVLYLATLGRRAFGTGDTTTIRNIVAGRYEKPRDVNPDYPAALAAIVEKCLSTRPDERFQSARELRTALEAWLDAAGQVSTAQIADVMSKRLGLRLEARARDIRAAASSLRHVGSGRRVRPTTGDVAPESVQSAAPRESIRTVPLGRGTPPKATDVGPSPANVPPPPLESAKGSSAKQFATIALFVVLCAAAFWFGFRG